VFLDLKPFGESLFFQPLWAAMARFLANDRAKKVLHIHTPLADLALLPRHRNPHRRNTVFQNISDCVIRGELYIDYFEYTVMPPNHALEPIKGIFDLDRCAGFQYCWALQSSSRHSILVVKEPQDLPVITGQGQTRDFML
jgi:hypothetical protein